MTILGMESASVFCPPVARGNSSKPLLPVALADDTPSRHPCKIRIPSAQKRFMFDPYKAQVTLGLDNEGDDESSDDCVDDDAFGSVADDGNHNNNSGHDASYPPRQTDTLASESSPLPVHEKSAQRHNRQYSTASNDFQRESSLQSTATHDGLLLSSSPFPAPTLITPCPQQDGLPTSGEGELKSTFAGGAHFTNAETGCFRMIAGNLHHALVRFKFSEDVFVVPHCDRRGLSIGDLVVVEGDRGENIGTVVKDVSDMYNEQDDKNSKIIRRALNKDRKKYYHARRKDALASKFAQQTALDLSLKMHVLDGEFQADLMKLTIYYRLTAPSGEAVDFRELQRALFKQFRCRIWLINWDDDKRLQSIVTSHLCSGDAGHQSSAAPVALGKPQAMASQVEGKVPPRDAQWANRTGAPVAHVGTQHPPSAPCAAQPQDRRQFTTQILVQPPVVVPFMQYGGTAPSVVVGKNVVVRGNLQVRQSPFTGLNIA